MKSPTCKAAQWKDRLPNRGRTILEKQPGDSGQTMIFMIMALIILVFVVLWNLDLHQILHLKSRTQNAGDAAALAAARWQGLTLNLVGDLNIMQALNIVQFQEDPDQLIEASEQISGLQARLAYAGPMLGLLAAQQAAKQNNIFINHAFTDRMTEHAGNVRDDYPEIFAEPYSYCWDEYSEMIMAVALEGIAAAPDNARFYRDYSGEHMLLLMSFYDAVASRDWCWFKWHAYTLLETYMSHVSWPDLPPMVTETDPSNSEIFGLGLAPVYSTLPGGTSMVSVLNSLASERGIDTSGLTNEIAEISCAWMAYDPSAWGAWTRISPHGADPFPAAGAVRPQYDYAGADAAIRIEAFTERFTPGTTGSRITWTAAAKPFGSVPGDDGGEIKPNEYSLVLPAFREVRLIPVDASSAPEGGAYNLEWREHIEVHLPYYMLDGLAGLDADCWFCRQLVVWEEPGFRQSGINWLSATNAVGELLNPCETVGGPGPGPGGGRRRAH